MPTINIKKKCPKGENGGHEAGESRCSNGFDASLRTVYGTPKDQKYRVCRHKSSGIPSITNLKYDKDELTYEGGPYLVKKHNLITEVCTYYSAKYDPSNDIINVPLILGVKENTGGDYTWYENTGNNITWRKINHQGKFPEIYNQSTKDFTEKLIKLTCKLHNFHSVNVYESNVGKEYCCPVCGGCKVMVSDGETSVLGYTKYRHKYSIDTKLVRYNNTLLKYRDPKDEDDHETDPNEYQPIQLLAEQIPNLTVYYWNEDKKHTKPLVMEVDVFGNAPVSLGNDGKPDNSQWTMIADDDGLPKILPPGESVSPDTLHKQRCKLFRPVIIDVTSKGQYKNPHSEEEECKMKECSKEVKVTNYSKVIPELKNYTALKHTYGDRENNKFTITSFKNGPSEDDSPTGFFPIWNVTEVVVLLPKCDGDINTPLVVHVKSEGGGARTWSKNSCKRASEWKEETELENNLSNQVTDILKTILESDKQQKSRAVARAEEGTEETREPWLPRNSEEEKSSGEEPPKLLYLKGDDPEGPVSTLQPPHRGPPGSHSLVTDLQRGGHGPAEVQELKSIPPVGEKSNRSSESEIKEDSVEKPDKERNTDRPVAYQVPDTESETKILLQGNGLLGSVYYVAESGLPELIGEAGPPSYIVLSTGGPSDSTPITGPKPPATERKSSDKAAPSAPPSPSALHSILTTQTAAHPGTTKAQTDGNDQYSADSQQQKPTVVLSEQNSNTNQHEGASGASAGGLSFTSGSLPYSSSDGYLKGTKGILVPRSLDGQAGDTFPGERGEAGPPGGVDAKEAGDGEIPPDVKFSLPKAQDLTHKAEAHNNVSHPTSGPLDPPQEPHNTGSDSPTNIIVSVTTGILTTFASACFGGWKLYNRSKGDPWVRQI
ncbi:hypothetical protein BEWA_012750 [Theileria equi strain WA]|uniref:Uncharacterized protein n=1 Tax=Theileria equi strain WA TaxID=1537102 RepID=L1LBK4_THEEQ|nr:hypothetical protein BEWA_012750 [Theileria equi strain WA]EKX72716.1 hypothetical protein BEWA_012750 [Theileria equi strain WA]|eukprot:XP_004832168.1 hypothetical protein BEWA_012750 [Theileria equi strain WA]